MLNRDQIHDHLKAGRIFRRDTWDEGALSGASYDLRIADDRIVTAKKIYNTGAGERASRIVLNKGETAMVSTAEKFCVPWGIVGNMSQKFSLAKEGLLVHTGSIVDPGYGMRKGGKGWEADEDVRVHFYLVNVGKDPIILKPGQSIVTIQFSEIEEPSEKKERPRRPPELGADSVEFFSVMNLYRTAQEELQRKMEDDVRRLDTSLGEVSKGYQQLVFFGIYVLAAALLTIFGANLLALKDTLVGDSGAWWFKLVAAVVLLFLVLFPAWMIYLLRKDSAASPARRR